ncbi:hypothetical protein M422DRAFT_242662 [Sphaerobolus stellatus SS14]|nr:hypothetical protein M422DRAFT_242662 [Sphaerobolus stellatus SS14]
MPLAFAVRRRLCNATGADLLVFIVKTPLPSIPSSHLEVDHEVDRRAEPRARCQPEANRADTTATGISALSPMDNSKGITIEVKRLLVIRLFLHPPSLFRTSRMVGKNVHLISTFTTNLANLISAGVKQEIAINLEGEDRGDGPLQVLMLFSRKANIRTGMNAQVEDAQRRIAVSDVDDSLIVESASSSVDIVSKGGSTTVAIINTWEPVWTKFNAFVELTEKISERPKGKGKQPKESVRRVGKKHTQRGLPHVL